MFWQYCRNLSQITFVRFRSPRVSPQNTIPDQGAFENGADAKRRGEEQKMCLFNNNAINSTYCLNTTSSRHGFRTTACRLLARRAKDQDRPGQVPHHTA